MQRSRLIEFGDGDELLCPRCRGANLHHRTITVFARDEDAETTMITVVEDTLLESSSVRSHGSGNPSSRRDALSVRFMCEHCDNEHNAPQPSITLNITQHKGSTYFEWVY